MAESANLFPTQVFQMHNAELFNALIIKVEAVQLADRAAFGFEQEVERREEQVDMLGIQEIRDESQDGIAGLPYRWRSSI